jgi:hypothetical protein
MVRRTIANLLLALAQAGRGLVCAWKGHDKTYLEFGTEKVPYCCKRCGRMWNEW